MKWSKQITLAAAGVLAFGLRVGADDRPFVFTAIDVPNATATGANGINARGEIVGFYRDASKQHGYLWSGEAFETIDVPDAVLTDARGISPGGDIVSAYRNPRESTVKYPRLPADQGRGRVEQDA
jgi:hypothetical protein